MAAQNDERILELKKQIEKKREELGNVRRFNPITTCILELFGNKINLHTLTLNDINKVMIELNMYVLSCKKLGICDDDFLINGFKLSEWCEDVRQLRNSLMYRSESKKLKNMEVQLDKLLSEDKKTELEIDSIAAMLNGGN